MHLRFSAPNQTDRFDTHKEGHRGSLQSSPVGKEAQRDPSTATAFLLATADSCLCLLAVDDCLLCIIGAPATTTFRLFCLSAFLPPALDQNAEAERILRSGLLHHPNPAQL